MGSLQRVILHYSEQTFAVRHRSVKKSTAVSISMFMLRLYSTVSTCFAMLQQSSSVEMKNF